MKINFTDPEILIPIGVILVCVAAFIWAVGQLFKKSATADPLLDDLSVPAEGNDLFGQPADQTPSTPFPDFTPPPPPVPPARSSTRESSSGAPPVSKEMVDRLDTMSQRLSDMQGVLQRQAAATPAGGSLPPETIDKLLKIVGSVTQQVDLLQRSMGAAPASPALGQPAAPATPAAQAQPILTPPPAAAAKAAAPAPTTVPAQTPAKPAAPAPAKSTMTPEPSGKGIGLAGGALSKVNPESGPAGASSPTNPTGQ